MRQRSSKSGPHFTEAARKARLAAREAKRAEADSFGEPELFVVTMGDHTFTWELRRFGGVILYRGSVPFGSEALARIDGKAALAALRATPGLPTFKRQNRCRASSSDA